MTISAPEILTALGAAASIFLCCTGSAVASIPAGMYAVRSTGWSSLAPLVIAGVLAIYGFIVAILLATKLGDSMDAGSGYKNVTAGLCVGLACWASGMGMGRFLDKALLADDVDSSRAAGSTADALMEPLVEGRVAVGRSSTVTPPTLRFLMVLVYLEAIGLYGLIVALVILW